MLSRLLDALSAVCPMDGAAYVNGVDSTGGVRLDYAAGATGPQQAAAQAALASFDWSQSAHDAWLLEQDAKVLGATRGRRKTADEAFSSNAFSDVADLQFLLAPNTHYKFRIVGAYTSAASATGAQFSVTGPASPDFLAFVGQVHETATTVRGVAGGAYDVALAGAASAGATPMPFWLEGSISTGAQGGLFKLRARSETNGTAITVKRGSLIEVAAVQ